MNDAPLAIWMFAHLAQRDLLAVRRREQNVADLRRGSRDTAPAAHDEIERPLALHDLGRRRAADRGLDQPVDRVGR